MKTLIMLTLLLSVLSGNVFTALKNKPHSSKDAGVVISSNYFDITEVKDKKEVKDVSEKIILSDIQYFFIILLIIFIITIIIIFFLIKKLLKEQSIRNKRDKKALEKLKRKD